MRRRFSQDMRQAEGFTIPELLVAGTLLLIMTGMMVALLIASFSLFRRQSGKSDTYRGCMVLLDRFEQGLSNSQLETVTISTDQKAVSWQLGQTEPPFSNSSGNPIMLSEFEAFHWLEAEQRVVQERVPVPGTASVQPQVLPLSALQDLRLNVSPTERSVALNVTDFRITDNDDDPSLLNPPLRINVTCTVVTRGTASNDEESYSMQASATPRSQRW